MTYSTITQDLLTVSAIVRYIKTVLTGHSLVLSFQEVLEFCQDYYRLNDADEHLIDNSLVNNVWKSL